MSYKIGLVGLPNVGKSSLFNFLTKKDILIANYPFATIDPNVGIMILIDPRLEKLSEYYQSQKTTPSAIEIVDIAGLVKGASQGSGSWQWIFIAYSWSRFNLSCSCVAFPKKK